MVELVGPDKLVDLGAAVLPYQVPDGQYELKDGKLEYPPDVKLESHQDVSAAGQDERKDCDHKRGDREIPVHAWNLCKVVAVCDQLPNPEAYKQRREYQVDQAVRYEYDPECDDQQTHQQNRSIDPESVVNLGSRTTYQE